MEALYGKFTCGLTKKIKHKKDYSNTCVKRPLSNENGFQDQLSLNAGQKYMLHREHSANLLTFNKLPLFTGSRSTVGNVSGNRCESNCRSRGHELDHGPVPYFRGD